MDDGNESALLEEITLAEHVYRALRRDIIAGAVEAGQSLRLEFLKDRYGISFSPIREALNRLWSERLVVPSGSGGFCVAPLSIDEMQDAIETRILIDSEALRRSLANGDDRWEVRLVGAYHALMLVASRTASEAHVQQNEKELLEARHFDFHNSLISACGSRWLMDFSSQMYSQTERYRSPSLNGAPGPSGSRDVQLEHQGLMDAAVTRDADRAVTLLAHHYRETGRQINADRA